ncbi:MAG: energy-coupling factor transporter transmembrane component T family protein [Planctomycetota bacterium]
MHIHIDEFADDDSLIHRWDVRVKLVTLSALGIAFASTRSVEAAGAALGIALYYCALARLPFGAAWMRARWVVCVLAPLAVVLAWQAQSAWIGVAILLRGVAIMVLTLPLVSTARFADTLAALRSLHVPGRLLTVFLFTYRYLFLFLDDLRSLELALAARGYVAGRGVRPLRMAAAQVGNLLVRSFEKTERIHHAMQVRGFRGQFVPRRSFSLRSIDVLFGVATLLAAAALLYGDMVWWRRLSLISSP